MTKIRSTDDSRIWDDRSMAGKGAGQTAKNKAANKKQSPGLYPGAKKMAPRKPAAKRSGPR